MSGGRKAAFGTVAGMTIGWGWVALAASACGGDAFTTARDGSIDGSTPVFDAGPPDGQATDGQATDGRAIDGGPVDAGAGWCASQGTGHVFCEDFLHGVPDQLVENRPQRRDRVGHG